MNGLKKITLGFEDNIRSLHAEKDNCWLNTNVFDAYLSHLVVPDAARKSVSNHVVYIPDHILRKIVDDSPANVSFMCYSRALQKFLLKNIDITNNKDDVFCFGGHKDHHFFLLLMFVAKKEFIIVDPLDSDSSTKALAILLHVMIPHFDWLNNASAKDINNAENYNKKVDAASVVIHFNRSMMNDISVYKIKPGSEIMPRQTDSINCGLYAMLLCETYMRGFLPDITKKALESIRSNCHLESSLASGVPLLGERSVYTPGAIVSFKDDYNSYQKKIV